jgi:hexosaminidase
VIPNIQFANYMTYPRAFAISESVWSPKESKNFENFISRTEQHFTRFDASKTNISKAIYDPIVTVTKDGEKLMVTLQSEISNAEIFYTIDNTYPVNYGTKYINTFEVPEGELSLRTQLYRNGQPVGRLLQISREQLLQRIK